MSRDLPRDTPANQYVDPVAVLAFLDAVEADPVIELHSLMLVRHGHVVAEGWWAPHTPERTRLVYSLSKSFTSTAVGMAVAEGLFSLDDTVISHFPELEAEITDPRTRRITLRHLASMASGHNRDMLEESFVRDPQQPVRGFLSVPPDGEPGSLFSYNQLCTYTLARVVQRTSGLDLTEYLRPRLFDPLGIGEVGWAERPAGHQLGFSGLFARTEDVAKLGQLYLQRGSWGGSRLLPESWVAEATSKQVDNSAMENPDWQQGYGYQFWIARHGYRGDGAFGQFCVVLPEHDTVLAMTGGTEAMQAVLDHVWEHLLPGLGGTGPDDAAHPDLAQRLASLRLPACSARPAPGRWEDWTGSPLPVGPSSSGGVSSLISVQVAPGADGPDLTLTEPSNTLTFRVGSGDWLVSDPLDATGRKVPVATSGGWLDDGTLRVEVIFLETPHRMDITGSTATHTAQAVWRTTPLDGGRIATLRRP